MSGKLKNRTRTAKVYNLTTKVAPVRHMFARRHEHRDGKVVINDRRLVLPDSITILGKKESDTLPDAVLGCPEIAGAIERRDLVWVPDPETEKKAKRSKKADEKPADASTQVDTPKPRTRNAGGAQG